MKIIRIIQIIIAIALVHSNNAFCQLSDENWDLMLIREDHVYPSSTMEYEMSLADLKQLLSTKNMKGFNYFVNLRNDYSFTHVIPLNKIEDLKLGIHSIVAKQVNDPLFDLILNDLKETTKSYRHYIVRYLRELSYIPEDNNWNENSQYRRWSYFYCQPGKESEVEKVLSEWKKLYESKGIEMGFRVFSGFIGIEQPLYILTIWAEDPLAYQTNLQEVSTKLGEDGAALMNKMFKYVNSTETIEGWYLPQYSFAPNMKLAE